MPVPSKPVPQLNEPNATADPKTRDLLTEIVGILTDGVDRNNLKDGEVTKAKLATDALNAFLKLAGAADRKVAWGSYLDPGSWGNAPDRNVSIPHGQGVAPQWFIAWASPAVSTASSEDPVVATRKSADATNLVVKLSTLLRGNCNFPGVTTFWIGIF